MNELAVAAVRALTEEPSEDARPITSDLTIDESLLLHSAGWEPTELVAGVSVQAVPMTSWNPLLGQRDPTELTVASAAVTEAFRSAGESLRHDCAQAGGAGVVGVRVTLETERATFRVELVGTAVRPIGGGPPPGRPFVTDLSTRDFVLLERAGWRPLDLVYGASFVLAPRQRTRQVFAQVGMNVELTNLTGALQQARERAMERLQHLALDLGAGGVVDVSIQDGPLGQASHVLAFLCYGTAVVLAEDEHRRISPDLVLPLDEEVRLFEASALRESGGDASGLSR